MSEQSAANVRVNTRLHDKAKPHLGDFLYVLHQAGMTDPSPENITDIIFGEPNANGIITTLTQNGLSQADIQKYSEIIYAAYGNVVQSNNRQTTLTEGQTVKIKELIQNDCVGISDDISQLDNMRQSAKAALSEFQRACRSIDFELDHNPLELHGTLGRNYLENQRETLGEEKFQLLRQPLAAAQREYTAYAERIISYTPAQKLFPDLSARPNAWNVTDVMREAILQDFHELDPHFHLRKAARQLRGQGHSTAQIIDTIGNFDKNLPSDDIVRLAGEQYSQLGKRFLGIGKAKTSFDRGRLTTDINTVLTELGSPAVAPASQEPASPTPPPLPFEEPANSQGSDTRYVQPPPPTYSSPAATSASSGPPIWLDDPVSTGHTAASPAQPLPFEPPPLTQSVTSSPPPPLEQAGTITQFAGPDTNNRETPPAQPSQPNQNGTSDSPTEPAPATGETPQSQSPAQEEKSKVKPGTVFAAIAGIVVTLGGILLATGKFRSQPEPGHGMNR